MKLSEGIQVVVESPKEAIAWLGAESTPEATNQTKNPDVHME